MPISTRHRDGRRHSRSSDEEYVVFIQGIPPQCRWQELKDLVRQTALHIRQAVVYDDCNGHPTGLGQIIIKNEDEAWRTYHRLSINGWNGNCLTVTLSLASAPTKPIAGPTRSPSTGRVPYTAGGFSNPQRCAPPVSTATSTMPPENLSPPPPYAPSPEYSHFVTNTNTLCHTPLVSFTTDVLGYQFPVIYPSDIHFPMQASVLGPQFEPSPIGVHRYSISTCIQPLYELYGHIIPRQTCNTNNNNVNILCEDSRMSPSCSIFIQNLASDTTWQYLKDHLRKAGIVERCDIREDRKGGGRRSRGYATATFRTKEEARRAITLFDNTYFKGSRIRVRFDRDNGRSCSFTGNGGSNGNANGSGADSPSHVDRNKNMAESGSTNERGSGSGSGNGNRDGNVVKTSSSVTAPSPTDPKSPTVVTSSVPKSSESRSPKRSEPLVVNGSRVGLRAGRSRGEKVGCEGELGRKIQEIQL
ncbi:hypothetical protein ACO22_06028 [Paracoccidioides brasiliensis]|uniref:RRM domain-containing protein n=1 Tax=Paracoccidioides brasiliensis TaxID=121759 RepID=A0A1D2J8R1_PARBR|nr:hypothetical protein ACO22_06028 [Paracoccidioides brasiliensis]